MTQAPLLGGMVSPGVATRRARGAWRSEILRICLVPLFVVLCYQFEWRTLRFAVSEGLVFLGRAFGLGGERLSFDSFVTAGRFCRIVISCTAVDVFFGSIPLLWSLRHSWTRNLTLLAAYFGSLSLLNLLRLALGFVLYRQGISWLVAHEVMGGVFYFTVFLWIARQRGWDRYLAGTSSSRSLVL